tara:strand:- start:739 stop:1206 length:468 start_codon:yes stop_codon:yes gene_type:complete
MFTVRKYIKFGLMTAGALALAVSFSTVGSNDVAADGHGDRSTAMKQLGGLNKALGGAVAGGNAVEANKVALQISAIAAQIPHAFKGGSPGTSRAKAEIWSNWDDFVSKAVSLQAAADVVAADATAGSLSSDPKKVVGSIGATCGACHKVYRGPRQ